MILRNLNQHAILYATLLSLVALGLDYLTGPTIRFLILFVFPVLITSWYRHWYLGMGFAVVLSFLSLGLAWYWHPLMPQSPAEFVADTMIRGGVLVALGYSAARHRELRQEVRTLSGILPICSFCKRIRDSRGSWQVLESYIKNHSEAEFSHGLCPSCAQEHYGELLWPQDRPQQVS
jgi:hypothetical protein